jgi:hypothetical protein
MRRSAPALPAAAPPSRPRAQSHRALDVVPSSRARRATWVQTLRLLSSLSSACTGSVLSGPVVLDDAPPGAPGPTSPTGHTGLPGAKGDAGTSMSAFQAAPVALRKLTVRQYQNTVRDLFGPDAVLPAELEPDTSISGFHAIGAAKATVSPSAAERFEAAAYALAEQALDATHRSAFVGCTPAGTRDTKCTTDFVTRFGLRALRRPLGVEEVTRYVAVAEQAQGTLGDFYSGLAYAVAGLLQSPSFLFRVELGTQIVPAAGARAFDDYEMASRLSYLLWNTTPDAALLEAAARGELTELSGLRAQAERLLADPRAKLALDDFHSERLALDELESLEKDRTVYGELDDSLRAALRTDVLATIEEFTFGEGADFRSLFTTRVAYVESKLASLYGLPAVGAGTTRVELPASAMRVGLLGKVAFLAANAHPNTTSPTKRGKYVRERLLCQSIPAPPPEVATVLPEPDPSAPTMRARLQVHAQSASCAGCHKLMDPIGLSLEHFDAIGRYRADDGGHALDVSAELDGKPFDGAIALATLLRDDPRTSECTARQLYRYAVAHVETDGEEPALAALIEAFERSGHRFTTLLRALVVSDGFRFGRGE